MEYWIAGVLEYWKTKSAGGFLLPPAPCSKLVTFKIKLLKNNTFR